MLLILICWCCWCAKAADTLMMFMMMMPKCAEANGVLMLPCCLCCLFADATDTRMLMHWYCWCAEAIDVLMHLCSWCLMMYWHCHALPCICYWIRISFWTFPWPSALIQLMHCTDANVALCSCCSVSVDALILLILRIGWCCLCINAADTNSLMLIIHGTADALMRLILQIF